MAKDMPPWYHGGITADEATKILTKFRRPGAFLLRDSQNTEGAFTLSVSCSVEETGNFVDVQHYRILKNRLKKKFPSMKDLDKCLQQQTAQRGIIPPSLDRAVEKSMIEEWDGTDAYWREKFRVHEGEKHAKRKDPNKHSSMFSRFRLRKKKKQPNIVTDETGPSVQLQEDGNSFEDVAVGKGVTESHSGDEDEYIEPEDPERDSGMSGNNAKEDNDGIYTLNRDSDQGLNQNIGLQKQAEDDCSYDNDSNSNNLTKSTTTKDFDTETNDEGSNSGNDNQSRNANTGIYMSPSGIISRNNEVPGNDSFNQVVESNNGIYMSTSGTTPSNEMPRRHEGGGGSSVNSGIYMSPKQDTNKDNGGSRSQEVGVDSSVTQNEIQ